MRLPRLSFLPLCVVGALHAASFEERVDTLFRPPLGEMMALSPDGQRVAYTRRDGRELSIVMIALEPLGQKRVVKPLVERDPDAPPTEPPPAVRLRFLRWATPGRLVFAPVERVVPLPSIPDKDGRSLPNPDGPTIIAPIWVTDADGRQQGTLTDARAFQETPAEARRSLADLLRTPTELAVTHNEAVHWKMPHLDVLGFLPRDREQVVLQTHGAYSMPTQHVVDIRTGNVREFGDDWPTPPGEPQVFDWYRLKVVGERKDAARATTAWRDDDLAHVQRALETKFPHRVVEILDWSETRARVLFRVTGGSDAGRVFVFQRTENVVLEVLRCAPWLTAAKLNETRFFATAAADGAPLSGYVTWPNRPGATPPPLLVEFPSGFPGHAQPAFDPEAQVLADLGFVVVRLNHRGVGGVRSEDLGRLREAVDAVSVHDARAAIEWLAQRDPQRAFDRARVVAFGRGFGGYLAARALQLEPALFRCGVAIDAPMELRGWLRPPTAATSKSSQSAADACGVPASLIAHDGAKWSKLSVVEQAETLKNPLLVLFAPRGDAAVTASIGALRERLQALGRTLDTMELDAGFAAGRPDARVAVYRRVDEFLGQRVEGFAVKIGPVKEVQ